MAIVFKTPKSTLNTTSKQIQNLGGDCPPCPEPVLESKELEYTQNGEYTVTPEQGVDGFSSIDVTVNVPSDVNNQNKSVTITDNGISTVSADSGYSGLGDVTVEVNVVPTMAIAHITPTTEHQTVTPPAIYDGFASVEVNAVTSQIDSNIAAGNIKDGVTILGVTGNYSGSAINNQNKTVSPSTSQQSVSADQGYTGLGTVTVNAVTSSIDQNIAAGNIKDGVTILGVTGTYEGSGGTNCPDWSTIGWNCSDVTSSGLADDIAYTASIASTPSNTWKNNTNIIFAPKGGQSGNELFRACSNLRYVSDYAITGTTNATYSNMFRSCSNLTRVGNITAPNRTDYQYANYTASNMFSSCSKLISVGTIDMYLCYAASEMFSGCSKLTTVGGFLNESGLVSVDSMFSSCSSLSTAPLFNTSNVTNMSSMFSGCTSLVSVPQYDTSKVTSMQNMFNNAPFGNSPMTTAPSFNTSNVTSMRGMFGTNTTTAVGTLVTVPLYDCTKVTDVTQMFNKQSSLTNLAGFTNLGKAFVNNNMIFDLSASSVLTKQSIMNVINNLAAPDNPNITGTTLQLSAASYALLDASDIAIATAKNWSVISA